MHSWTADALALLTAGQPVALITILSAEGSTPRDLGTRMIVTPEQTFGTIGGGNLEHIAIGQARALLGLPAGAWRAQDYPLGPLLGQCCGGRIRLLLEHLQEADLDWIGGVHSRLEQGETFCLTTGFEEGRLHRTFTNDGPPARLRGPRPEIGDALCETFASDRLRILLFGYGHVGRALNQVLSPLPYRTAVFDTRPQAQEDAEKVQTLSADDAVGTARTAGRSDLVLIMTHDHALDYRLTLAALRGDSGFVGLIGSATKRARFVRRLRDDGVDEAALRRLCCPIGLDGVEGKQPEVIAVSVAAQMLMLRGTLLAQRKEAPPLQRLAAGS